MNNRSDLFECHLRRNFTECKGFKDRYKQKNIKNLFHLLTIAYKLLYNTKLQGYLSVIAHKIWTRRQ